ncbi:hypothetical protein XENOCAPTIV_017520, partial [Xenoophorus captivus]
ARQSLLRFLRAMNLSIGSTTRGQAPPLCHFIFTSSSVTSPLAWSEECRDGGSLKIASSALTALLRRLRSTAGRSRNAKMAADLGELLVPFMPTIRVPKTGDRVYKSECAFSFDSPVSVSACLPRRDPHTCSLHTPGQEGHVWGGKVRRWRTELHT